MQLALRCRLDARTLQIHELARGWLCLLLELLLRVLLGALRLGVLGRRDDSEGEDEAQAPRRFQWNAPAAVQSQPSEQIKAAPVHRHQLPPVKAAVCGCDGVERCGVEGEGSGTRIGGDIGHVC